MTPPSVSLEDDDNDNSSPVLNFIEEAPSVDEIMSESSNSVSILSVTHKS